MQNSQTVFNEPEETQSQELEKDTQTVVVFQEIRRRKKMGRMERMEANLGRPVGYRLSQRQGANQKRGN